MLKKINIADYDALKAKGEILQSEGRGPKVIRLPGDRVLKLFRRKRLLSSQIWITHATRFARNADKLRKRGIPTIQIESTFRIPAIERQAVLYKMLAGETLRDWLKTHDQAAGLVKSEELGAFVAELHRCGILFRSIHFGNIVVQTDGSFGLIDIADTGFSLRGSLSARQRIRNFHHMDRNDADRSQLAGQAGTAFMEAYLAAADVSGKEKRILTAAFDDIFAKYNTPKHV